MDSSPRHSCLHSLAAWRPFWWVSTRDAAVVAHATSAQPGIPSLAVTAAVAAVAKELQPGDAAQPPAQSAQPKDGGRRAEDEAGGEEDWVSELSVGEVPGQAAEAPKTKRWLSRNLKVPSGTNPLESAEGLLTADEQDEQDEKAAARASKCALSRRKKGSGEEAHVAAPAAAAEEVEAATGLPLVEAAPPKGAPKGKVARCLPSKKKAAVAAPEEAA